MAAEQRTDLPTGLTVSFVESLDDAIEPIVGWVNHGAAERDLFDVDHVIVPNAGVRAWLLQMLSTRIGTGPNGADGIAAGLSVRYIGELDRLIGKADMGADPWAVGPLAISLLSVIDAPDTSWAPHVERMGGGLRAARLMADRFDRYHARRPSMILEWEDGHAALAREAEPGRPVSAPALDPDDTWQFDLWRRVRDLIDAEPWPVVLRDLLSDPAAVSALDLPPRLLLVGHQSLSVRHIELLTLLATRMQIVVVMQHPSPTLAERWSTAGNIVGSPGVAPAPVPVDIDDTVDPLVGMWLRGSREAQMLLRSQGVPVSLPAKRPATAPGNVLEAIKESVRRGVAVPVAGFRRGDPSFQLHRAHNLSRQVEIVHQALLHAFAGDPELKPHEVVVLCADIAKASPLLTATFSRRVDTTAGPVRIPLVVADRGLRQIDEGARLLSDLLAAVEGRFSVADVLAVAQNPLVRDNFGAGEGDIDAWDRFIDRGNVRWGLSAAQRAATDPGLDLDHDAHTWESALGQALVGAMLPQAPMSIDFGGVVPMVDVEPSDLDAVGRLLTIVGILSDLHADTAGDARRSVIDWADRLEAVLTDLAGDDNPDIEDALRSLNTLREHVIAARGPGLDALTVTFAHFAQQVEEQVSGNPGRQSVRTGAVVASSLVPMRGVPFKVVCLVGFDEGSLSAGESEGDDLVGRQQFAGDADSRLEDRRSIIDAVCAAGSRVIVTCNGRSVKNNEPLPLVTPLAELLDLCERCGVAPHRRRSGIEFMHPRHFSARRNFESGVVGDSEDSDRGIVPGMVWSHDRAALRAVVGDHTVRSTLAEHADTVAARMTRNSSTDDRAVGIDHDELRRFLSDPLRAFVRGSLRISTWRDAGHDVPAVIPFDVDKAQKLALYRDRTAASLDGVSGEEWVLTASSAGALPLGVYGELAAADIESRVDEFLDLAAAWGFDPAQRHRIKVDVPFDGGHVQGVLHVNRTDAGLLVVHMFGPDSSGYESKGDIAFTMLLARAMGFEFTGGLLCNIGEVTVNKVKTPCTVGVPFVLDPEITPAIARERIETYGRFYVAAMDTPLPLFGGTAEKVNAIAVVGDEHEEKARDEFASYVTADGRFGKAYVQTNESLVYGPLPDFDAVFGQRTGLREVLADFFDNLPKEDSEVTKKPGSPMSGYKVPPHPTLSGRTIGRKMTVGVR